MNFSGLISFYRLVLFLLPFLFVQRWFHTELQRLFLLVTRNPKVSLVFFSVLFFPGVLLHEGSHFLAAKLLGLRTGKFSLKPQLIAGNKVRMGFVETERADFIRNSLVGAAPLIFGGIVVAILGIKVLNLPLLSGSIWQGNFPAFFLDLKQLLSQLIFWIGLYLVISVSSMMMPSESDRRDWLSLIILLLLVFIVFYFAGVREQLQQFFLPWLERVLESVAMVFAFSLFVHLVFLFPLWIIRLMLSKIKGVMTV